MTARTANGIWESVSNDKGKTWSEPQKYLEHIGSRHFMRRLQSGRILMVRHGALNEKTKFRSKLTAYLSEDEGKTWTGGLMLDERRIISYPDGFQAPDGTIYVSYDHNRDFDGEILMARFTEKDILDGKFGGRKSKAKILISRPLGLDKLIAPSEISK
jgi:predicted neuraminidase